MACVRSDTAHSDNSIVRELKKRPPATMRACVRTDSRFSLVWKSSCRAGLVGRNSETLSKLAFMQSPRQGSSSATVLECELLFCRCACSCVNSSGQFAARSRSEYPSHHPVCQVIVPASSRHGVEASIHHIILCARYKPRTPPKALKSIGRYEVCLKAACCIGEAALNVWYDRKRNDIIANERSRCVLHTRTCRTACGLGCSSTLATPW
jgi:hypothetical protein